MPLYEIIIFVSSMERIKKWRLIFTQIKSCPDFITMKKIIISLLLVSTFVNYSQAQKEKYQSLFIYNFTKYIEWPNSYNSGKFVIGVIGDTEISESIMAMAKSKKKTGNGFVMEVKNFSSVDQIEDCNILFVSEENVGSLQKICDRTISKPMLIVTDTPGMANQCSIINFVEKDGKIKFELNESNALSRGLIISGSLASLAIII